MSFVSFCLWSGFALTLLTRSQPGWWTLGAVLLSAAAFATAKVQMLPLAVILALFTARLGGCTGERLWKAAAYGASILLLVLAGYAYVHKPRQFYHVNLYHSVFAASSPIRPPIEKTSWNCISIQPMQF